MAERPLTAVLNIVCADQPGIVAAISSLLYAHGGNIIDSDQHTDTGSRIFFLRVEWELEGFRLDEASLLREVALLAERFGWQWELFRSDRPLRTAIMVSRYDHCLYDLLSRHQAGELPTEIPLILSNHPDLQRVANHFSVPFHVVPVTAATKREAEDRQLALLAEAGVDLVVLARYMQILSPRFVAAYPNRIINIHHSFLPAFIGANPYQQAFERGVKVIGATAHYVTSELDQGPIIEQSVIRVSHRDDARALAQRGRDQERVALAHAVRMHLEHRVLTHGNKTVVLE